MYDLTMIEKKNICIIGLMGSGKSVIGKDLSKYLNFNFYDTDKEIEVKAKKSISAIFEEDGESYFRALEEKICLELLTNDKSVISLGGGSIINKRIRKLIKQNSYSIYLEVKLSNLVNRVKASKKRPLLNKELNKIDILKDLYNKRRKFYEKADLTINNDNDKFQVLKRIKSELKSHAN